MHFGTWLYTLFHGKHVGSDMFGNKYYVQKRAEKGKKSKRWVIYKGMAEPSKVPPLWHAWLHYTTDKLPGDLNIPQYSWQKDHVPNLTGTKFAYKPKGDLSSDTMRTPSASDYQPWVPPSSKVN